MVVFKRATSRILAKTNNKVLDDSDTPKNRNTETEYSSDVSSTSRTSSVPGRPSAFAKYGFQQDDSANGNDNEKALPRDLALWITRNFSNQNVGILVSDMSGFTRLTRAHGIVHFASIIMRMRQICLPILHFFEALFITTEADNFIVVFGSAAAAALAALSMQQVVAKYNESLPSDKNHFALTLNGVGVDFGEGPLVDKNGKLHGRTFASAYTLGEDLCEAGCVLISGKVRNELERSPRFTYARYLERTDDDAMDLRKSCQGLFDLQMDAGVEFKIPLVEDSNHLSQELVELTMRHSFNISPSKLDDYDDTLRQKYMQRRCVLMFEFEFEDAEDTRTELVLEFHFLRSLKGVLDQHHALEVEDVMYMFTDPVEAILVAIKIQERYEAKAALLSQGSPRIKIRGMGVHMGDVLWIPQTDVHWGDPINTASKLGQDLATGGDILISDVVWEAASRDDRLKGVTFQKETLTKSRVQFTCYKVIAGPVGARPIVKEYSTGCWSGGSQTQKSRGWIDYLFCACACDRSDTSEPINLVNHDVPDANAVDTRGSMTRVSVK